MIRKIVAVDTLYAENVAIKQFGFRFFPIKEFVRLVNSGADVDVIETIATLQEPVPASESAEDVASTASQIKRKQHALESNGAKVILCPSKRMPDGGFKQSDDQRLMIHTLSLCLRLKPDFLTFVGADGDYAPLIWELRNEGIRTEVVAESNSLANDLKRASFNYIDLSQVLAQIKKEGRVV